jgi:hypothetical protein
MSNQDKYPPLCNRQGMAIKRAINDFKVKVESDPHISNLLKKEFAGMADCIAEGLPLWNSSERTEVVRLLEELVKTAKGND